jgi:DNA-binding MarR family transcriptional regulator
MAKIKARERESVASLDRSPSHLLHRALQLALDIYAEELGPGAITQRQYAVLAAAAAHEGATQTDLVKITGIDRSTLADMVARMLTKELLERERSTIDARANAVRLTEAGKAALAEAEPKMAAADARLLKLLPGGGKRAAFVALLRDITEAGAEPKPAKAGKPSKAPKAEKPAKKKKAKKAKAKALALPELVEA